MQNAGTILRRYYDAVQKRDMAGARRCLADDMVFVGLFETYPNADAYIATFTQLMQIVVRLDIKSIVGEGENAMVFMEMETTAPVPATTLVAEWHRVRDGKIAWAQSAFDGRPFAAMFTPPQDVAADERAIRALKDAFGKALLSGDAKARAALWTEDGTVAPPQGGLYQGRAAMARHFESEAASITPMSGIRFANYRFRFLTRDAAHVDTDITLTHVRGPDGATAAEVPIQVSFTAIRQPDGWHIQDERAHFATR
ncbi:MAG TPA: nuclear transport factor 2 family protein [Gammaproteobacteria bacterium]|nr:nuclear transport factor 2 family protein [Gammaproteobacteria bacterium]